VCGVHWKSDIEAGRLIGSAAVARLHDKAEFTAQMAVARHEIAHARPRVRYPQGSDIPQPSFRPCHGKYPP
jgi:acid phosphatase (class A)